MSIYDASQRYQQERRRSSSSPARSTDRVARDWAAKGPLLLGVRAVIAESFERIHRSNLVGMGILPLQFRPGETPTTLGLTGEESFTIRGLDKLAPKAILDVEAKAASGDVTRFKVIARVDDPIDLDYMKNGGVLPFVFRELLAKN